MKNVIVLAGVGFAIGLAGGTGISVLNAPPPEANAVGDSSHVVAASAGAGAAKSASGAADHGAPNVADAHTEATAGASPLTPDSRPTPNDSVQADLGHKTGESSESETLANDAGTEGLEGVARLARILVNMKPREAVQIIAYLSDDQVEAILRSVGVRHAAALLTEMPKERGAALSRRLIERPGNTP